MFQFLFFTGLLAFALPAAADSLGDGLQAYEAGRYGQAIQLLTPLANQSNSQAQFRLGMMHYHGQGVPEDEKLAVYWLRKAAAQGHTEAMFELGNAFLLGHEAAKLVPDPDREAALWYFQAASAGHAEAQYHLGLLFLAGKGVIESRKEALSWFRKAAAQDHGEAKRAIGRVAAGK
ncbi:MAG: sel1 repeat family protein [Rhodocyclales bacterium]|nr:sel1 repeat family protein [Rhodocyclales bacterium]